MSGVDKRPCQMDGHPEFSGPGVPEMLGLPPREVCGRPVVSKLDGKPLGFSCNLTKHHLGKCAETLYP